MKWFLLGAISLYRRLPIRFKRQCLFRETCSSYIGRVAREFGFLPGLQAFRTRVSQCKPGYLVFFDNQFNRWHVRFANGSVSNSCHVADFVLAPYIGISLQPWAPDKATGHAGDGNDLTVVTRVSD
jgi:putative component of membrane protein insertase Oxa1/YidC/SpoIIIJ protein YidD